MPIESGTKDSGENKVKSGTNTDRREFLKTLGFAAGTLGLAYTAREIAFKISDENKVDNLKSILDAVETGEKLSETEKQELRNKIAYLINELDQNTISLILSEHEKFSKFKENSLESVKGFEKLGLTEKQVRDLLKFYPAHAVAQVRSLEYSDQMKVDEYNTSFSGDAGNFNDIHVHKDPQNTQLVYLSQTLSHELAHVADWQRTIGLSLKQRLEFLYEALKVYEVTKFIKIGRNDLSRESIGKMKIKNHETRRYRLLVEWWANLCMEAQENPKEFFKPANKKEVDLVKKYLVGQGKDFNFEAALKTRKRYAAKYFQRQ